ncbi:iron uptake transporter permease EfeU [Corynebacterium aquatimens]|uniref:High-affinity iron transporter n=1 Tax=Corynebacterium aquatimens TaxID=1190508 RepID=A0A931GXQ6_9CORY|nr:iron uptake transporter permease EfeU [Corynebacterium aquatimens]MBG6122189.1 high-affinity iron transporter [Corynebacterium aquatimens]WJY65270.1 Ferrous iron permease EfeU [Corynebacterium aquatimens]
MFIAAFIVGLREGLEASLIVGVLLAAINRREAPQAKRAVWSGVGIAALVCLVFGAIFTFGRYGLSFKAQEIMGGVFSLIAVAMITGMVLSMSNQQGAMRRILDDKTGQALAAGASAMFWLAFVAVGREGIELTLMLWGWVLDTWAIIGAVSGIIVAIGIGWGIYAGALRLKLQTFFTWSSVLLIIVAAGITAYAIHDLQEAQVLPGPFSGEPIAPTHPRTGEVLTGFITYPFWMASFPFGWAFDFSDSLDPNGFGMTLLQAFTGFEAQMSWLQVIGWATYMLIVVPKFIRNLRQKSVPTASPTDARAASPANEASEAVASADTSSEAAGLAPSHQSLSLTETAENSTTRKEPIHR